MSQKPLANKYDTEGKTLHKAVTGKIIANITADVINPAAGTFGGSPEGKRVDEILKAVKEVCETFANKLEMQIPTKVTIIVGAIESEGSLKIKNKGSLYNGDLNSAVQRILFALAANAKNIAAELHSLVLETRPSGSDTSIAGKIKEAHEKSETLKGQFDTATGKGAAAGSNTNHAQAVDNAITQVQTQVQHITGPADNVNLGDSSISTKRDKAYTPLDQAIKNISGEASALSVEPTETKLKEWSGKIKDELSKIVDAFVFHGTLIKGILTKLEKDLGRGKLDKNTLQDLHKKLTELQQGPVTKALNEANDILEKAEEVTNNTLRPLKNKVDQQVSSAISELSTLARKQYISSIQSMLTEFSKKVEEELEGVPEEIEKDLEQGHKKFMKLFEDNFVTRAKVIADIDPNKFTKAEPPLHQAARRLSGAISALFINCQKVADLKSDFGIMKPTQKALDRVLTGLWASNHFDNKFSNNLDALNDTLATFNPKTYGEGKYPYILESFKKASRHYSRSWSTRT
ncbi:hypothetical protein, conserved [Babesia ovata]|uniref:Extracellular matrix-binding ebh n=1 Tax=Babesia ovata TaxID=189622 RepID=A0A2H6KKJ9_9APIC|nr:uncharacterized protein BOVATA_050170 [Babesia ovata]GBE63524.1 hypothetical protein, conserved [Babesia ovata]